MPNVSFAPANNFDINFRPGVSPESVALGDFNNDGKLDLATTTYSGNNVLVALGNGSGGFSTTALFAVASRPSSISVGDFNNDGSLDLVTGNAVISSPGSLSFLFGNGTGSFGTAATITGLGNYPDSVKVADFNGDGKLDLATANYFNSNVSILFNTGNAPSGNATFSTPTQIAVGGNPTAMRLGDFNGDGKLDLVTANVSSNNVSVLLGNGSGFNPAINSLTGTTNPRYISVADFNSDSKLDLAIVNAANNNVSILLGNGNGTFATANDFVVGSPSYSVSVGDFNSDGKPDVATSGLSGVSVLLGNGDGTLGTATNLPGNGLTQSVSVGDFNGDSQPDLVTTSYGGFGPEKSSISVFLNNGNPTANRNDFNGDKKSDILWRNDDGRVSLWQMNGATSTNTTVFATVSTDWKIANTGDFNGDSKSDILWRNDDGSVNIWLMNGDNVLSAGLVTPYSVVDNNWKISGTGDFNGDGKADILWRNTDGSVAVWEMNGNSVLNASLTSAPYSIVSADWKIAAPIL